MLHCGKNGGKVCFLPVPGRSVLKNFIYGVYYKAFTKTIRWNNREKTKKTRCEMAVKKVKKTTQKTAPEAKVQKPVKTQKTAKTLKQVKAKAPMTAEENLKKLAKSKLPMLFVKKHSGAWNHQDWLVFLEEIHVKGYDPIDTDSVGLILEEKKAVFLAGK